ncbi:MAG: T9SS type A sorting domain-containing protein [Candidatus Kapabacteria bacterium]|jgi:hypothetical protein|nr:T9SS type A sorting domain-containing protein [Candidatus Kapabacteria bacterium]
MKRILIIKILLFLISISLSAEIPDGKWEIVYKLDVKFNGYGTQCYLHSIGSADKKNIIAAANINYETPYFITSQDSGKTWKITHAEEVQGPNSLFSHALAVPDTNLAIVVCDSGAYWRSTDNGLNWTQHFVENRKKIMWVDFWDNKSGIIFQYRSGEMAEVRKTTNGGLNWLQIEAPKPVNDVFATSYLVTKGNGIIYSIEADNKIDSTYYFHKSTDYGETWQKPYKGPDFPPGGFFYFFDENLGFCYGDYGLGYKWEGKFIRRTSDGGRTWEEVLRSNKNNNPITDVHFSDSLNGIAASVTDIYRTFDGGKTWLYDSSFIFKNYYTGISYVYLIDQNNAIGLPTNSQHNVMRFTAESTSSIISNYMVSQIKIFPNPTASYIKLDWQYLVENEYEYTIFTIDGKEIQKGIASETIHIQDLPSGSYYLILSRSNKLMYSKFIKK